VKIGVLGGGSFAREFIPLFQAHPDVSEVVLAEVMPERRQEVAAEFGLERTATSLDELCAIDVDAVAIFTQRWLHAPPRLRRLTRAEGAPGGRAGPPAMMGTQAATGASAHGERDTPRGAADS